jgi:hypothetical protein
MSFNLKRPDLMREAALVACGRAATRRLSFFMMLIWMPPLTVHSCPNSPTTARLVIEPIESMCRTVSMTPLLKNAPKTLSIYQWTTVQVQAWCLVR